MGMFDRSRLLRNGRSKLVWVPRMRTALESGKTGVQQRVLTCVGLTVSPATSGNAVGNGVGNISHANHPVLSLLTSQASPIRKAAACSAASRSSLPRTCA